MALVSRVRCSFPGEDAGSVMKEGLRPEKLRLQGNYPKGGPQVEYVGIDWGYERAAWCGRSLDGQIVGEGLVPADADGLPQLVVASAAR